MVKACLGRTEDVGEEAQEGGTLYQHLNYRIKRPSGGYNDVLGGVLTFPYEKAGRGGPSRLNHASVKRTPPRLKRGGSCDSGEGRGLSLFMSSTVRRIEGEK